MKYINQVRKFAAPVVVVAGTVFASTSAFAVDISVPFNEAKTDAMANMDMLTIGLIALALFPFGLTAVLAWSRK